MLLKRIFLLKLLFFFTSMYSQKDYCSPLLMKIEIEATMNENDRQIKMRNNQIINMTAERYNKKEWSKFQKTYVKIQNRLRHIDFALQAIPTGYDVILQTDRIKDNQKKIIEEVKDAPYSIIVAIPDQIKFLDELHMVYRFLVGIIVSYGSINQMEKAERQTLLKHAQNEIRRVEGASFYTLSIIRQFKMAVHMRKEMMKYYVNRDKQLVENILKNVKSL